MKRVVTITSTILIENDDEWRAYLSRLKRHYPHSGEQAARDLKHTGQAKIETHVGTESAVTTFSVADEMAS